MCSHEGRATAAAHTPVQLVEEGGDLDDLAVLSYAETGLGDAAGGDGRGGSISVIVVGCGADGVER